MGENQVDDEAFVSLVTNDNYANGALVLGYSLRRVNTTRKLALLVTNQVTAPVRQLLSRVWDYIETVDPLDSGDDANLALLTRPELGITFTKIRCWNLTQYSKCVFLDADTLVLQNCDELFDRRELSAVPDIGWPDCFNSGVFVLEPSRSTYEALLQYAIDHGSFDGGDQGLLNSFFSNWATQDISTHLSFIYNMNSNASYTYAPAHKRFGQDVKIVHFIGPVKPWQCNYSNETGNVYMPSYSSGPAHESSYLRLWWDIYITFVLPGMRNSIIHQVIDQLNLLHLQTEDTNERNFVDAKTAWENGCPDYTGTDRFENIQVKLDEAVQGQNRDAEDVPVLV